MKASLLWLAILVTPAVLWAQQAQTFRITGQLRNTRASWVYLIYTTDKRQILDSAAVHSGSYVLTGKISSGYPATLLDLSPRGPWPSPEHIATLYLMPGSFSITHPDSFSHTIFTGSPVNTAFKKLTAQERPYKDREMALLPAFRAARGAQDDGKAGAVKDQVNVIERALDDSVYAPFAAENPHSPLALYVLQRMAAANPDAPSLLRLFSGLSPAIRDSKEGTEFHAMLALAAETGIGTEAMDFVQNDTAGNPVSLSSFRGNYVLLDFWASWCGPCRAENPHVVSAYARYHGKGFAILSVSLDRPGDREKWLKAIHTDGLTWTQVSDLQFWNNAVARQYGVQSIPQNFLIDPQGKIIARGLHGSELMNKLGEIYKD